MPRDFKSFSKENNAQKQTNNYEDIINKYKDMDSNELTKTLFKEANKLKSEGKLDSETLNNLRTTLTPFLNQSQKEMLSNLIDAINE